MDKFVIHFFKERTREIDHEKLFSFFKDYPEIHAEDALPDAKEMNIFYRHPVIKSDIKFVISSSSVVKDIYMIKPQYLDVNFRLEMPVLTPYYIAGILFEIVRKLVAEFDFFVYNKLLENAIPYKVEQAMRIFELTKKEFKEKSGYTLKNYYFYPEDKLSDLLRYVDEQHELQLYYKDKDIYVPNYYVVADDEKSIHLAIEWEEGNHTVFPPHLSYIYYISGLESKTLPYTEVMAKIEKYTNNVPGFLQNTKVTDPKQMKRIMRTIKKTKFTPIEKTLIRVELSQIIDL